MIILHVDLLAIAPFVEDGPAWERAYQDATIWPPNRVVAILQNLFQPQVCLTSSLEMNAESERRFTAYKSRT